MLFCGAADTKTQSVMWQIPCDELDSDVIVGLACDVLAQEQLKCDLVEPLFHTPDTTLRLNLIKKGDALARPGLLCAEYPLLVR